MIPLSRSLYLWRTERRLTQDELARKAGVSRPNLSAMERGRREVSLPTLRRLASALEIRAGLLVDGVTPLSLRGPRGLSREEMERIADAAMGRGRVTGRERALAQLLRTVMESRIRAWGGRPGGRRSGKRRIRAAWLQFKSACPPGEVRSLIQRVEDREGLG